MSFSGKDSKRDLLPFLIILSAFCLPASASAEELPEPSSHPRPHRTTSMRTRRKALLRGQRVPGTRGRRIRMQQEEGRAAPGRRHKRAGTKLVGSPGRARRTLARRRTNTKKLILPPMTLYHVHSHEVLKLRLYDDNGRIRPSALRAFARFLRYYKTGEALPIHWRIAVLLYDLWIYFGQPQISIYSGYRPVRICELRNSKHILGKAVDFSLDGVPNERVRDYLLKYGFQIGVGYYPNSYHVHLDVRSKNGFWIDYSGPGQKAMFAEDPWKDLRKGLARKGYKPRSYRKKARRDEEPDDVIAAFQPLIEQVERRPEASKESHGPKAVRPVSRLPEPAKGEPPLTGFPSKGRVKRTPANRKAPPPPPQD